MICISKPVTTLHFLIQSGTHLGTISLQGKTEIKIKTPVQSNIC